MSSSDKSTRGFLLKQAALLINPFIMAGPCWGKRGPTPIIGTRIYPAPYGRQLDSPFLYLLLLLPYHIPVDPMVLYQCDIFGSAGSGSPVQPLPMSRALDQATDGSLGGRRRPGKTCFPLPHRVEEPGGKMQNKTGYAHSFPICSSVPRSRRQPCLQHQRH